MTAAGVLERRPVLGSFRATLDRPPDGLEVSIGQGVVPALLLRVSAGRSVTVLGADGVPFLRLDERGVYANPESRSFRDNLSFADFPRQRDGWARVGQAGSATWSEPRLAYSADRPPEVVARAQRSADLGQWRIPVTIDGKGGALSGTITWVPTAMTLDRNEGGGIGRLWPAVVVAALIAAGVVARRRRPSRI